MAILIVECLEMIDIDHQQRQARLVAPRAPHFRVDEQIELATVGQPRQCVLQRQQLKVAVEFKELVLGAEQLDPGKILLFHQLDQAITEYAGKPQQQQDDPRAEQGLPAPARQNFCFVQRGENDQGITLDPPIPDDSLDIVNDGTGRSRP